MADRALSVTLVDEEKIPCPPKKPAVAGEAGAILAQDLNPAMNRFTIRGDWNVAKGKLKQKYGQLTDRDLIYDKGREDELLGRLQQKLGVAADEIARIINGED